MIIKSTFHHNWNISINNFADLFNKICSLPSKKANLSIIDDEDLYLEEINIRKNAFENICQQEVARIKNVIGDYDEPQIIEHYTDNVIDIFDYIEKPEKIKSTDLISQDFDRQFA